MAFEFFDYLFFLAQLLVLSFKLFNLVVVGLYGCL
jgi:hypothetical protein